MADNSTLPVDGGTEVFANDDIGSVKYPRAKLSLGADGAAVDAIAGNGAVSTAVQRTTIAQDCNFGTPIKFVTVAFTANADAVDVGDVVAATQAVAACTRGDDMPGILHSLTLITPQDVKAKLRIVLFDANTALGTEDAAPDIDDTEILTVQGMVDIAVADYVDLGGASVAHKSNLGIVVKPATGTDDIYAAIYTPDTSTPDYAGGDITVRFGFIS
jgi:hypothetical protein